MQTEISKYRNPRKVTTSEFEAFLAKGEIPFCKCGTVFDTSGEGNILNENSEKLSCNIYIEAEGFEFIVGWLDKRENSNLGLYHMLLRHCRKKGFSSEYTIGCSFNELESALNKLDQLIFYPNIVYNKVISLYTVC